MAQFDHVADLQSLRAAIAASPIVVVAPPAAPDFAAWCQRQAADIDSVILDWLRAQAPRPATLV